MSILKIRLVDGANMIGTVCITAEEVMEKYLTVTENWVGLPKLISIANIIERINNDGFELADDKEIDKIASLITTDYTSKDRDTWQDQGLTLRAARIPDANAELYEEVSYARDKIRDTARKALPYNPQEDAAYVNQIQDGVAQDIQTRARNKPALWIKILGILLKTGVTAVFNAFVGIPLDRLVARALGGFFGLY